MRKIIELCHTLGLEVVAEGIETPSKPACSRRWGATWGKGTTSGDRYRAKSGGAAAKAFPNVRAPHHGPEGDPQQLRE